MNTIARPLNSRPKQILIVDDDEDSCAILAQMLTHLGHEATCTSDPIAAMSHVINDEYQVIFLDLVMPGLSGYDLLRATQSSPYNAEAPVVAVSAHAEFQHDAMEGGFVAFLHKPPELARLRVLLDTLLGPRQTNDTSMDAGQQ